MRYLKNRKLPVFLASLVTLLFVPGCYSKPLRVKYGESHSISELIHVHDSPVTWLSVGAKKYKYVMGDEPYYINVPGRADIFFITSNQRQTDTAAVGSGRPERRRSALVAAWQQQRGAYLRAEFDLRHQRALLHESKSGHRRR